MLNTASDEQPSTERTITIAHGRATFSGPRKVMGRDEHASTH